MERMSPVASKWDTLDAEGADSEPSRKKSKSNKADKEDIFTDLDGAPMSDTSSPEATRHGSDSKYSAFR